MRDSSVHFGQVGQPNPEPVSLTIPPVTTISIWLTKEAQTYRGIRALETILKLRSLTNNWLGLSWSGMSNNTLQK